MEQYIDIERYGASLLERSNMRISTMTITCNLNVSVDTGEVLSGLPLSADGVVGVYTKSMLRILPAFEDRVNERNGNFMNCIAVIVHVGDGHTVNVKLFNKGTIHATGIKGFAMVNAMLGRLYAALREPFARFELPHRVTQFKIGMIKIDCKMSYLIIARKLELVLKRGGIMCHYEPSNHAPVNIPYGETATSGKSANILVFSKGSIIITSKHDEAVNNAIAAHRFIVDFLTDEANMMEVRAKPINELISKEELAAITGRSS